MIKYDQGKCVVTRDPDDGNIEYRCMIPDWAGDPVLTPEQQAVKDAEYERHMALIVASNEREALIVKTCVGAVIVIFTGIMIWAWIK